MVKGGIVNRELLGNFVGISSMVIAMLILFPHIYGYTIPGAILLLFLSIIIGQASMVISGKLNEYGLAGSVIAVGAIFAIIMGIQVN